MIQTYAIEEYLKSTLRSVVCPVKYFTPNYIKFVMNSLKKSPGFDLITAEVAWVPV